jgi:hypothetical protein
MKVKNAKGQTKPSAPFQGGYGADGISGGLEIIGNI